ncbi:hypothetical protein PENTCL1PPCAC_21333 [Pristionchus entomophagus]|uniref:Syntaxin N-terminal domain-containing protein n=1 Tax=Pristionchus entomophagus TaxID=358040 RepID=A0AAV5TY55_9BILA|nr:hypothetical protein PENTCL1PPCAC_21333 [Pristionchus entomophagus]
MDGLENDIDKLHDLHVKILSRLHNPDADEELKTKTSEIHSKMRALKKEITSMHQHLASSGEQSATVSNRIIKEQANRLIRKLLSLGEKFENEQMEYKEKTMRNYSAYLNVCELPLFID